MNGSSRPTIVASILLIAAIASCKSDGSGPDIDFEVRPGEVTLMVGGTQQLSVVGAPGDVIWSSTNGAVATVVPATGFVTAVARGEATISAVSGSNVATARVLVTAPPAIALSAPVVDFDVDAGEADPVTATVNVSNAGDGTLSDLAVGAIQYASGQASGWLESQLSAAGAPATLTLRVSPGSLQPGAYSAVVPVTASNAANSPQNVVVNLAVVAPPRIDVDRPQVSLVAPSGGSTQESLQVTNGGGRPLTGLATSISYVGGTSGWLTATLSATTAPATLALNANAAGLAEGTYTARVDITSTLEGVAPKTLDVVLAVGAGPAIALSPATVAFNAALNGSAPPPRMVAVTNAGGGLLTGLGLDPVTYAQGASGWLTATIDAVTAPATITLTVDPSGLATGSYDATVTVRAPNASNSPAALPVTLTIGPPPMLAVTPSAVNFATFVGGTQTILPQAVAITNASGSATIAGVTTTVTYTSGDAGWLGNVVFQGRKTSTPATLLLSPSTTGLSRGTHVANVEIRSSDPTIAPVNITVTYVLQSFSVDIWPLFTSSSAAVGSACSGCHPVGSSSAAAHGWLSARLAPLQCKIATAPMAGGGCPGTIEMRMTPAARNLVQAWIDAGAPSN